MTTRIAVASNPNQEQPEAVPGVATNVADEAAAQEAVALAARNGKIVQPPAGSPEAAALTAPEKRVSVKSLLAKAKVVAVHPATTHTAAAVGGVLVAVGYEYVAAKQDWPRFGLFDKKNSKK